MQFIILEPDIDTFIIYILNYAQTTIVPPTLSVVLDKHNLSLFFENKVFQGWEGGLGKLTRNPAGKGILLSFQLVELNLIYIIYSIPSCCKSNKEVLRFCSEVGIKSAVYYLKMRTVGLV